MRTVSAPFIRRSRTLLLFGGSLSLIPITGLTQSVPSTNPPSSVRQGEVSVLEEFEVHAKKAVPFTDANMDTRGEYTFVVTCTFSNAG